MFQKGHTLSRGNKGGGRKKKTEEFAIALEEKKEEIKQEAIQELAKELIYKTMKNVDSYSTVKEIALPIHLKGMTEKIDHTTKGESLNQPSERIKELAEKLLNAQKQYEKRSENV